MAPFSRLVLVLFLAMAMVQRVQGACTSTYLTHGLAVNAGLFSSEAMTCTKERNCDVGQFETKIQPIAISSYSCSSATCNAETNET